MFKRSKNIRKKKKNALVRALSRHKSEIIGVFVLGLLVFLGVSLISFNPGDNSWFHFYSKSKTITNWGGAIGANFASLFFFLFGSASYLVLGLMAYVTAVFMFNFSFFRNIDRIFSFALFTLSAIVLLNLHGLDFTSSHPGGLIGFYIGNKAIEAIGRGGALISFYSLVWIAGVIMFRMSIVGSLVSFCNFMIQGLGDVLSYAKLLVAFIFKRVKRYSAIAIGKFTKNKDIYVPKEPIIVGKPEFKIDVDQTSYMESKDELLGFAERHEDKKVHNEGYLIPLWGGSVTMLRNSVLYKNLFGLAEEIIDINNKSNAPYFDLPDLSLFQKDKVSIEIRMELEKDCKERAYKLEEKLRHFGIEGSVTSIHPGPVITLFEYTPEIGTKISKIISLEDDLAMVLRARSIRIIAPIPGRSVVGFEISNKEREEVFLSDILHSDVFQKNKMTLPLVLGVDIVGKPVIEDLLKMPHLLVAGSTGSGKSVGMNAMLVSLLCRMRPDELRLVLIDPKRLEFSSYRDIPHLLFPIVTDPRKVPAVLKWVVKEMEHRYEKMAEAGVRNLADYRKLKSSSRDNRLENLPYIVVMIDELADLMMVAGKDVEIYIARIAQMARAAGIHMIIATQRPSVDVLTGIIKVNFPSRVSFRVSSRVDSKTILDSMGAEKLLGKGDMLCISPRSSELERVHGAYVSDEEISKLAMHLREQQETDYLDIEELVSAENKREDDIQDDLYPEIVEFVKNQEEISISMLQRKYRIGFNRSARLIEKLEANGIVAPAQGGKPRKVL